VLLLDADDELPSSVEGEEQKLAARLGEAALKAIDANLVSSAQRRWLKLARVVHDAIERGGFEPASNARAGRSAGN
jgi:hypothetical protein